MKKSRSASRHSSSKVMRIRCDIYERLKALKVNEKCTFNDIFESVLTILDQEIMFMANGRVYKSESVAKGQQLKAYVDGFQQTTAVKKVLVLSEELNEKENFIY